MKLLILVVAIVCLSAFVSHAARQTPTPQQRLHFKIGIPPGKQPVLLLPHGSHTVELSALTMDRNETSVHLKGAAEIRLAINRVGTVLLQTDEAVYDLNTAEIETTGNMRMTSKNHDEAALEYLRVTRSLMSSNVPVGPIVPATPSHTKGPCHLSLKSLQMVRYIAHGYNADSISDDI